MIEMENATKKTRLRAPNFTISESNHLIEVLEKYKHIIENKKTDGASLKDKQKAWLNVVADYNSTTTTYSRTLESLQQCYKNMKKKVRKKLSSSKMSVPVDRGILIQSIEEHDSDDWQPVSEFVDVSQDTSCQDVFEILKKEAKKRENDLKKDRLGTGGGPPKQHKEDLLMDKMCSLVGPTMEGMYTIYDGNSALMECQDIAPVEAINKTLPSMSSQSTRDSEKSEDETSLSNERSNLTRKPNPKLTTLRKLKKSTGNKTVCNRFKNLATHKMDLVKLKKQIEEQRLMNVKVENKIMKLQMIEQKEKLSHTRMLQSIAMEEAKKTAEHNELQRQFERENLLNKCLKNSHQTSSPVFPKHHI